MENAKKNLVFHFLQKPAVKTITYYYTEAALESYNLQILNFLTCKKKLRKFGIHEKLLIHIVLFCSILRGIALVVILMRAGLGLDPQALKRLSGMVFRLAFTPCLVETVVVAVASHLLLGYYMFFIISKHPTILHIRQEYKI